MTNPYTYPCFKGIYYKWDEERNMWILYKNYEEGLVMQLNGDIYKLDQCFEKFLEEEFAITT